MPEPEALLYAPEPVPSDGPSNDYLLRELRRVQSAVALIVEGRMVIRYAAPKKPRTGMIAWADGTSWNPGSGAGLYEYRGGTWNKL